MSFKIKPVLEGYGFTGTLNILLYLHELFRCHIKWLLYSLEYWIYNNLKHLLIMKAMNTSLRYDTDTKDEQETFLGVATQHLIIRQFLAYTEEDWDQSKSETQRK